MENRAWRQSVVLALLFVSESTTFSNRRWYSTRKLEEQIDGRQKVHQRNKLRFYGNVSGGHYTRQKLQWSNLWQNCFFRKISVRRTVIIKKIKLCSLFGFVQCDIHVPEQLREQFAKLFPIFKNINVWRQDIGPLMWKYAKKVGLMNQPAQMLISSFQLAKRTIFTIFSFVLIGTGFRMHNISTIRWVHSCVLLQRLFANCCWCFTTRIRKTHFQCYCGNNEIVCQEFVYLSNYGS